MARLRGRGHPLFSVCVAGKGVTDGKKRDVGAFLGCVAGNGLSSFWLVFTINGTAEGEFSQWLICSKTGKRKRLNAEGGQDAQSAQRKPSFVSGGLSARACGLERLHVALDLGGKLVLCNFQLIAGLKIHPENRVVLEIASESQSCLRGDATFLVDDIGDASDRHA